MKNLVIFSGGQDSTMCVLHCLKQGHEVITVTFDYGQKHFVEINNAAALASTMGVPNALVNMQEFGKLTATALRKDINNDVNATHPFNSELPASFVPNRNLMMLTMSYNIALHLDCDIITMGVSQEDYSGYPDCRLEFINAAEHTLRLSTQGCKEISLYTPLIAMSKADIFYYAHDMGVLDFIVNHTRTCYNNDVEHQWEWGYGCGECAACKLRKNGYEEFKRRI